MLTLKPSTRHHYIDALRQICDELGHVRMADLSPGDVADWFVSLPKHLSASTCNGSRCLTMPSFDRGGCRLSQSLRNLVHEAKIGLHVPRHDAEHAQV